MYKDGKEEIWNPPEEREKRRKQWFDESDQETESKQDNTWSTTMKEGTIEDANQEIASIAVVEEQQTEFPIECFIKYKPGSEADEFIEDFLMPKLNVKTKFSKRKCIILVEQDCYY